MIEHLREKSKLIIAGIMTGTSLDGIDTAICKFHGESDKPGFELLAFETFPFPGEFRELLMKIIGDRIFAEDISYAHFALSKLYSESVKFLAKKNKLKIDAVGIHGQTVWHKPNPKKKAGVITGHSLQLGNISVMAAQLGIPVIGDFRSADVALGGQGAPLVPVFDYHFLSDPEKFVIPLNIGGIANITLLPPGAKKSEIIAFDTGPGNVLIDIAAKRYFNENYDNKGDIARRGLIIEELLEGLKGRIFTRKKPPKSAGRELFNVMMLNRYLKPEYSGEDIIRTLAEFTAWTIAENIRLFGEENSRIITSGGGAKNSFLMERLAGELPHAEVISSDDAGINSDAKEAICFAFLAWLNIRRIPGNIPSVTGAARETVLGAVAE